MLTLGLERCMVRMKLESINLTQRPQSFSAIEDLCNAWGYGVNVVILLPFDKSRITVEINSFVRSGMLATRPRSLRQGTLVSPMNRRLLRSGVISRFRGTFVATAPYSVSLLYDCLHLFRGIDADCFLES